MMMMFNFSVEDIFEFKEMNHNFEAKEEDR
jgi:hypothetical protein